MATRTSLMEFQIPKIVHEEIDENRGIFQIEPLDRALLGQAALALEEELHAFPAADAALGAGVSGHQRPPPVGLVPASREKPLWQGRRECS